MIDSRLDKWLILQIAVTALILCATPFTRIHLPVGIKMAGVVFFLAGLIVNIIAFFQLGASFTPYVVPNERGDLKTAGIYRFIRHPMYSGLVLLAMGWSLFWGTALGILLSLVLFFVLDRKAGEEEKLLTIKYPAYAEYRTRVKKLIPFIY